MPDPTDVLHTPAEWEVILDVKVLDPDGWDRRNFREDWAKPLTRAEFRSKLFISTMCSNWSAQAKS
jgi:hypothetical protein